MAALKSIFFKGPLTIFPMTSWPNKGFLKVFSQKASELTMGILKYTF